MRFRYSEWDGEEFQTQAHLQLFDPLMELVLEYGDRAMDALRHAELDPQQQELLDQLMRDGFLEKAGAKWKLTPRAINFMQRRALMEVFRNLRKGYKEGHESPDRGLAGER